MCPNNETLIKRAIRKVNARLEKLHQEPKTSYTQEEFNQIIEKRHEEIKKLNQEQKKITFLLDEIDSLKLDHQIDKVKELVLNNYIDSEYKDYFINILMNRAIRQKDLEFLKIGFDEHWFENIKWDKSLNSGVMGKRTPLCLAIEYSTLEIQKLLIEKGASLENPYSEGELDEEDKIRNYFLSSEENLEILSKLIEFEKVIREKNHLDNLLSYETFSNIKVNIK